MKYITQSLLDQDFYKFTMGQLVYHRYPDVPVKYALINRTSEVPLADVIDEKELRKELDQAMKVSVNNSELHYLRGTNEYSERMFKEDYLEFFRNFRLPPYHLERDGNQLKLEFSGKWSEAIYWETIALPIVNELYNRAFLKRASAFDRDVVFAAGRISLMRKIRILKKYPGLTFCDFGLRRRFLRKWHDYVIRVLSRELSSKQFIGTSNTHFAHKHGLLPIGTSAHELFMVMAGIMRGSDEEIRSSHNKVLRDWWDEYGWGLSIALTDTYGTPFFFRDFTKEQAVAWKGLRQDSGDPFVFGENAIAFYENYGINPKEKLIVFSDGLDVETMIKLYEKFSGKIRVTFGWGTNLTNDLGIKPLSLVIKIVEANGHKAVKLSDNLAKATGDSEEVRRYKRIFGYTGNFYEKCKS